ncbi:MAG: hypothetical protein ACTHO8_01840 [Solirubrobacterales bacterium]
MAHAVIPLPRRKAANQRRARHFGRMEPMHRTAALDSKGMDVAITRGPR